MKKVFCLLFCVMSCGSENKTPESGVVPTTVPTTVPTVVPTPISVVTPIPTLAPTVIPEPEMYNYYQDSLDTTLTHEIGHALGLIHPFESVDYGFKCRQKLIEVHPNINFPIRDIMKEEYREDIKYWDYNDSFKYDTKSIMQYDVCRSGYIYDSYPSDQDVFEVNSLLHVFREDSMNLVFPIFPITVKYFRTTPYVDICIISRVDSKLTKAIYKAVDNWNVSDFKLTFKGICGDADYLNDHTIRINQIEFDGELLGNSRVGRSLDLITINIAVESEISWYVVKDKSYLTGKGLD